MQDAIILYENGKAIGGEGHPTDADDITFDNIGTDLISTNVESAIKEVNDRTKHGFYEIWKGSSSSTFAGQTVTISNIDTSKIDSIILEVEAWSDELRGSNLYMFDLDTLDNTVKNLIYNFTADGKCQLLIRNVTFTITSSSISMVFTDAERRVWNTYGNSASTNTTDNTKQIPYRVLALIHND